MRAVTCVVAFALTTVELFAQPIAPPIPALPPQPPATNVLPGNVDEAGGLSGGKPVSQPLQPVGPEPAVSPEPVADPVISQEISIVPTPHSHGPLGPSWTTHELLYWWPMRQPVPPLAYGTRSGLPPIPGDPGTHLLIGGQALNSQPSAGGRFTLGYSTNTAETLGIEVGYFFLGTRSFRESVNNYHGSTIRSFGLPYFSTASGETEIFPLGHPGETYADLTVSTAVRVQGWEVNRVANVVDEKNTKINFLIGWRYFQVHEGLRIEQSQYRYAGGSSIIRSADQFDGHNRFHGGQLGFQTDHRRGSVFCELTAKIAFGQTYEVVKNEGMTHILTPSMFGPVMQTFGGSGVYVQRSNAGRSAGGVFAVLPEGTVKFGFRIGEAGRVYVGYSFLYLSDAVRPGDQIDRALTISQTAQSSNSAPDFSVERPARLFNRSDFWVQGLSIGLETRY